MKKVLFISTVLTLLSLLNKVEGQMPGFTRLDDCKITEDLGNSQGSALADFDNDGDIDLLIGNTSGFGSIRPVLLYKNEMGGNFTRILTGDLATQYQGANMPTATCVDINNDGDWDVSTLCVFYMNNGYGEFTQQFMPGIGTACGDQVTSWVDIENDGDLDCSIWSQMATANQFYLNNGDGTFTKVLEGAFCTLPLSTEALRGTIYYYRSKA